MAATIEVKFFNSFLLKKTIKSNIPVWNGSTGVPEGVAGSNPVITGGTQDNSYYVEEARIRGGYNNTNISYGVRAYLVEDEPKSSIRFNSLIYSGIFNSRTGVNDTNVFSVGKDITKSVDPANGSIQRLYAEDTNLIVFQESKVSRALIDKDAIYSAEGGGSVTSSNLVIGQIIPYAGNFGISKNPESFAVYGYRKYFTDKDRNAVLRLSMDGITEVSNYGMVDYFRDELSTLDIVSTPGKIIGAWDIYNKHYVLSLQKQDSYNTLSFDEAVLGWTSFFDYKPEQAFSLGSNYYSVKNGKLWKHYSNSVSRNNLYGVQYDSSIEFVFNPNPSTSKVFKTVNYEGSNGWEVSILNPEYDPTDPTSPEKIGGFNASRSFELNDTANIVLSFEDGAYTDPTYGVTLRAGFDKKEGKYYANLVNSSPATTGEVVFGSSMTGVKGYYSTVTMRSDSDNRSLPLELFAVSSDYVTSAY
jgi:hypothetical protein